MIFKFDSLQDPHSESPIPYNDITLKEDTDFGGMLETIKEMFSVAGDKSYDLKVQLKIDADYFNWPEDVSLDDEVTILAWKDFNENLLFQLLCQESLEEFLSDDYSLEEIKKQV